MSVDAKTSQWKLDEDQDICITTKYLSTNPYYWGQYSNSTGETGKIPP